MCRDHEHHEQDDQGHDHLKVPFDSKPILLPINGMGALRAHDSHPKMSLDRVDSTASIATTLIAAGLDSSPKVVAGFLDWTPASVAVGHGISKGSLAR